MLLPVRVNGYKHFHKVSIEGFRGLRGVDELDNLVHTLKELLQLGTFMGSKVLLIVFVEFDVLSNLRNTAFALGNAMRKYLEGVIVDLLAEMGWVFELLKGPR